ncbi:MAG: CehA/McbA family metallohydrolase, partial [Thermoplasmata archaeon]|nr:CehA/McbA family metallohydrolase [Thermoplasmata archaeon]
MRANAMSASLVVFLTFSILVMPVDFSATLATTAYDMPSHDQDYAVVHSLDDYEIAMGDGHTHTNHSSGTTTVAENVNKAKERGLNWIAITDHHTISTKAECNAETTGEFICVVGEEVSTNQGDVIAWGLDEVVNWGLGPTYTMGDIIENIHIQGGLAVLGHPFAPDPDDYDFFGVYDGFDALEIYHGYAGFNDVPLTTDMDGKALAKWEEYLNSGWRKTGVGESDCHNASNTPDGGDLFNRRGAIGYPRSVIYVKEFSLRGIFEGIRSGRLYVTDGPELNFTINDRILGDTIYADVPTTLTINVSGVALEPSDLNVIRNGTQIYTQTVPTGPFSYSFTSLGDGDFWYRAEIRNPAIFNGEINVAFSNPIYFDLTPHEEPPLPPSNLTATLDGSDINLTWDPSPSPDVELYSIFRSNTFDGFNFSFPIAQTNRTAWTDKNAGLGDGGTYFYIVRAVDRTRLTDSNTNKAAKLVIPLDAGVHLVSIPLKNSKTSLSHVLQTLQYDAAWFYDNSVAPDPWKSYSPSKSINDLTAYNRT